MRDTFVKTLLELAKKDKNIHIITGDLGFGVLKPFWEELPDQITNVGIAEQNMTGFATGMALEGKIVYTYSIGNFPTLRTLEQIRNDAAYHNANVKIVCVGGGFVYGSLGMSHHATEDIAIMRSLPNVNVFAPGDLVETQELVKLITYDKGVSYLRLGRGGEKKIHDTTPNLEIGKAVRINKGNKIAVLSTGAIFDEVMDLISLLKEKNINPEVYTFPTVKPIDQETIKEVANRVDIIYTIEEHNKCGGFGSSVAEVMAQLPEKGAKLKILALNDLYSSIVGNQKYLRDIYGISSRKIFDVILKDVLDNN